MKAPHVAQLVEQIQAEGRLSFAASEIRKRTGLDGVNLQVALYRHAATGSIAKLSRKSDFFVIVPPQYRSMGSPPVEDWLDDYMSHLGQPYYLGLLSAATVHGSSHFAIQETQVVTKEWLRPLTIGRTRLRFFQSNAVTKVPVERRTGFWAQLCVSTPETTILDVLRLRPCGIGRALLLVKDLASKFEAGLLERAIAASDDTPNAQRLGFLLEQAGRADMAMLVKRWLDDRPHRVVPLETGSPVARLHDRRWNVDVNVNLDAAA